MKRRPPRSTRTDTLFPYTTLFRCRLEPQPPPTIYVSSYFFDGVENNPAAAPRPSHWRCRNFFKSPGQIARSITGLCQDDQRQHYMMRPIRPDMRRNSATDGTEKSQIRHLMVHGIPCYCVSVTIESWLTSRLRSEERRVGKECVSTCRSR